MGEMRTDPRRRALMILSGVTLAFVALATVALMQRASETAPKFTPRPLFPALRGEVNQVAQIHVKGANSDFHIVKNDDKGWTVVERHGFPAAFAPVRAAAIGMSELEIVEPKTANADFLDALNLGAPEKKGRGVLLAVEDKAGKNLAEAVFGKNAGAPDTMGRAGIFVRLPNENQAWLARGTVTASAEIGDWLDKNVVTVGRERIRQTDVAPFEGPAYTVVRDTKDQADFRLTELPKGRELAYDSAPDGVAAGIVNFEFDDVRPIAEVDFTKAAQITTRTFDGLIVHVRIVMTGTDEKDYWASVTAEAESADAQAEAMLITARASGWAFKLPEYKQQIFLTSRDSLLKPPGQPATP